MQDARCVRSNEQGLAEFLACRFAPTTHSLRYAAAPARSSAMPKKALLEVATRGRAAVASDAVAPERRATWRKGLELGTHRRCTRVLDGHDRTTSRRPSSRPPHDASTRCGACRSMLAGTRSRADPSDQASPRLSGIMKRRGLGRPRTAFGPRRRHGAADRIASACHTRRPAAYARRRRHCFRAQTPQLVHFRVECSPILACGSLPGPSRDSLAPLAREETDHATATPAPP